MPHKGRDHGILASARPALLRASGAMLPVLVALPALYLTSRYSYLLFHTLVELFTVVVSAGIFVIAWNARRYLRNNYLLFVGIASLHVALIDIMHTLAYQGLGVFPGSTSNLATQFWIAGRALEAGALGLAPFLLERRPRPALYLAAFMVLTVGLVGSVYGGVFPDYFRDGTGLTVFKVWAEYVIAAVFLAAAALLFRRRSAFAPVVWHLVVASLVLQVASELAFTHYVSVYGSANLAGHFLRLTASFLLYKAIIETGLVEPFDLLLRDLKLSQHRLEDYAAALEAANAELRRSEQRLQERAKDLAERNQELDAFTRTVAHDLKSPVAAIMTAAQTVSAHELPKEQSTRLLQRMAVTALDLSAIIDNLLLLARVRKEEVPVGPLDMGAVVLAVCGRFDALIRQHQAELAVPEAWPCALGYGPWIEEVWANYLTNALKYGGAPPRIELGADLAGDGLVRFWIRDQGPGLPADAHTHLFVPFRKLAGGQGHGLGLSIVLQIVQKLGGHAGVESEPGQGCLFYFTLPTAPPVS